MLKLQNVEFYSRSMVCNDLQASCEYRVLTSLSKRAHYLGYKLWSESMHWLLKAFPSAITTHQQAINKNWKRIEPYPHCNECGCWLYKISF